MNRLSAFFALGLLACGGSPQQLQPFEIRSLPPGVYLLRDNGIRCSVAPCPAINVVPVGPGEASAVSNIEYPSSMPQEERGAVLSRLFTPEGVTARGLVRGEVEGGLFVLEAVANP
jgi:hypothetical protein